MNNSNGTSKKDQKPKAAIESNKMQNAKKKKYVVYKLCIQRLNRQWFILRRYSEFHALYETLKKKHPHIKLTIPPKKIFGNLAPAHIQERQRGLHYFIQMLMNHPELVMDDNVRHFMLIDDPKNQPDEDDDPSQDTSGKPDGNNGDYDDVELGSTLNKKATPSDFEFIKVIGKGSFGKVYLAQHKIEVKVYAVKVLNKKAIVRRNEARHIMSERNVLLKNLKHPFLVGLQYSFQTKDKLYFVLDYINGGELFFHLQRERSFKENRARFYAAEIASAIGYLHEHQIIYRDLKPENLLLDKNGHIVLTDFGLAKEGIQALQSTSTFCGTPEYLAPEVIKKQPYTFAVDWWCLGAVLYEMIFGLPPFYTRNQSQMYDKILNQPLRFKSSTQSTAECKDILEKLLRKDPLERLGSTSADFEDIKNHRFFKEHIDFKLLLAREIEAPWKPNILNDMDTKHIDPMFLREQISASVGRNNLAAAVYEADEQFEGFSYARPVDNLEDD